MEELGKILGGLRAFLRKLLGVAEKESAVVAERVAGSAAKKAEEKLAVPKAPRQPDRHAEAPTPKPTPAEGRSTPSTATAATPHEPPAVHTEAPRETEPAPAAAAAAPAVGPAPPEATPAPTTPAAARPVPAPEVATPSEPATVRADAPPQIEPVETPKGPEVFGEISSELGLAEPDLKAPRGVGATAAGAKGAGAPPRQGFAPLSEDELLHRVLENRGFASAAPKASAPGANTPLVIDPKELGSATGLGFQTFGAGEIIAADGKQQIFYSESYFSGSGGDHAEEQIIEAIETALKGTDLRGATLRIAVDQTPCGPERHGCFTQLRAFSTREELALEIVTPEAGGVTPKTAARNAFRRYKADPKPEAGPLPSRVNPHVERYPAPEKYP